MQTKAEKRRTVLRMMAHQRRNYYETSLTLDAERLETIAASGTDANVLDLVREAERTRQRRRATA